MISDDDDLKWRVAAHRQKYQQKALEEIETRALDCLHGALPRPSIDEVKIILEIARSGLRA